MNPAATVIAFAWGAPRGVHPQVAAMTALVVVIGAYALMGLVALTFHHTHPAGQSCGWSGCQAKESP